MRLQQAGITPLGIGPEEAAAYQPVYRNVNGVRLAFLAFNAVPEPVCGDRLSVNGAQWQPAKWDEELATAAVATSRSVVWWTSAPMRSASGGRT